MRIRDLVKKGVERLNGDRKTDAESEAPEEHRDEQRNSRRVERFGWARFDSGEVEGQGLVTNLSLAGAMVERCSEPLDPGAKLVLRLKPAGGYETVSMEAEVVRATEDGFALHFTEASEAAMDLLAEAIEAALGEA